MINYIDQNEVRNSELLEELDSINMSINITYIVALSVFLTFLFVQSEQSRVLDQLEGVPGAENRPKLSHLPILSNKLLILTLIIAIKNNLESLNNLLNLEDSEKNRRDIIVAKKALLASILAFIASLLSYENLTNPIDTIIFPFEDLPL